MDQWIYIGPLTGVDTDQVIVFTGGFRVDKKMGRTLDTIDRKMIIKNGELTNWRNTSNIKDLMSLRYISVKIVC